MIGLPLPPPTVLRWTVHFDQEHEHYQTGFWLFCPRCQEWDVGMAAGFLDSLTEFALTLFSKTQSEAVSIAASSLRRFPPAPLEVQFVPVPNTGSLSGQQAIAAALGIYWSTSEPGKRGQSINRLPLADRWTADGLTLDPTHVGELLGYLSDFWAQLQIGVGSGDLFETLLGTVHRSRSGAPLPRATFAPFTSVRPVRSVATLVRRGVAR